MILMLVVALCIGSILHNTLYFRGRYGVHLFVGSRFWQKYWADKPERFALLITYVLFAPVGLTYLVVASLVNEPRPIRDHRCYLIRGWRDRRVDDRKWRYRIKDGKRSCERLERIRKIRESRNRGEKP